jgi:hypothetical protein
MTQDPSSQAAAHPWPLPIRRLIVAGFASGIPISLIVLAEAWPSWGYWAAIVMTASTAATVLACARLFRRELQTASAQRFQRRVLIVSGAYAASFLAATELARLGLGAGALGQAIAVAPIIAILAAVWLTAARKADRGAA